MNEKPHNLFKLTWPIYIELLFFMLMGVSDTIMLSQYSDLSVAAVGNANRIINLFTVLLSVVAVGVGVVVSQYIGAHRVKEAKNAIRAGIFSNFMIGLTIFMALQLLGRLLFTAIRTDEVIFNESLAYLRIVSLGLVFVAITQAISAGFKSFGQTKVIMVVVGITNILNILLNFVLIFGIGPFPALGIRGAAISTSFSKGVSLLIAGILIYKRLGIMPFILKFKPLYDYFLKIIKIGLPSAGESFVYQFTQVILLAFLNTIGVVAVTTQIYVFNLMMPVIVFSLAISQGNQVMVGWYVGAKDYDRAYKRSIRTVKIAIGIVFTLSFIMYLNTTRILGLFTDNQAIIDMGKSVMIVVMFLEIGRLSNLLFIQALRATGDVLFPLIIGLFSMLGIAITVSYFLGIRLEMGLLGIFIGLASDELFRGLLVFIRWTRKSWMGKRIVEDQA